MYNCLKHKEHQMSTQNIQNELQTIFIFTIQT